MWSTASADQVGTVVRIAVASAVCLGVSLCGRSVFASDVSSERAQRGVCQREGERIAGSKPISAKHKGLQPKQMQQVFPRYPELAEGTRVQRTGWLGEILIGTDGKVLKVWPLRENEFSPPFPAFNRSIIDALNQWQFTPLVVSGKPVPICMPVFVGAHWE